MQFIVNTIGDLMKKLSVCWGLALVSSFEKLSSLGRGLTGWTESSISIRENGFLLSRD